MSQRRADPLTVLVIGALTSWFVATVASQHPQRTFDRVRRWDRFGVIIPDWRFFAPEPGQHDLEMLHRVVDAEGAPGPWQESAPITPRRWLHTAWFPSRRADKALFDISNELTVLVNLPIGDPTLTPAYRMLHGYARRAARAAHTGEQPSGFQFMIVRSGGYDLTDEPDYLFLSPFVPWETIDA